MDVEGVSWLSLGIVNTLPFARGSPLLSFCRSLSQRTRFLLDKECIFTGVDDYLPPWMLYMNNTDDRDRKAISKMMNN